MEQDFYLTISTAGVSRRTIQNHIKQGRVSCELDEQGNKVIDAAELIRVYGELRDPFACGMSHTPVHDLQNDAPDLTPLLQQRVKDLERYLEFLERDREERLKREEQFYREKEELMGIIKQQQTQLLTLQPPPRTGFFARLFGARSKS